MSVLEDIVSKAERIRQFPSWRTKRLIDFTGFKTLTELFENVGELGAEIEMISKGLKNDFISLLEDVVGTEPRKDELESYSHQGHNYQIPEDFDENYHRLVFERRREINDALLKRIFESFRDKNKFRKSLLLKRAIGRSPYLNLMLGFKDHYETILSLIERGRTDNYFNLLANNFEKVIMGNDYVNDQKERSRHFLDKMVINGPNYKPRLTKALLDLDENRVKSLNAILNESIYKFELVLSNLNQIEDLELNAQSRIPLVLKKRIGGGADRDVFTALSHYGENCIIKIIDVSRLREEDKRLFEFYFTKGIVPEKEHAEDLSQHNIVPVYGYGPCYYKGKPTWYIIEKLIINQRIEKGIRKVSDQPSENFEQFLVRLNHGLTFDLFSSIFCGSEGPGLVQALDYLHRQGKTFGDIKPDNIVIQTVFNSDKGDLFPRPYFCDLENIRNLNLDSRVSGLTNHSHIYQPPERFDEKGEFILGLNTTQADIFAMGVTMFIALTGVHPFLPHYQNLAEIRAERSKGSEQRRKMNQEYLNNLHDRGHFSTLSERLHQRLNDKEFVEFLPHPEDIFKIVIGSIMPEMKRRLPSGLHLNGNFEKYSERYNMARQTEEYQEYLAKVEKFAKDKCEGRIFNLK